MTLPQRHGRVDIVAALGWLRSAGLASLLVEGGAQVITSLLESRRLVDRLVVSVAPKVLGRGTEGVGDLGVIDVASGLTLKGPTVHVVGQDVLIAGTIADGVGGRFEPSTNAKALTDKPVV